MDVIHADVKVTSWNLNSLPVGGDLRMLCQMLEQLHPKPQHRSKLVYADYYTIHRSVNSYLTSLERYILIEDQSWKHLRRLTLRIAVKRPFYSIVTIHFLFILIIDRFPEPRTSHSERISWKVLISFAHNLLYLGGRR